MRVSYKKYKVCHIIRWGDEQCVRHINQQYKSGIDI